MADVWEITSKTTGRKVKVRASSAEEARQKAQRGQIMRTEVTGRNLAREAGAGAFWNFNDEIAGVTTATAATTIGRALGHAGSERRWAEIYRDVRDTEREMQAQFERDHPGVAAAAQIAGGVAVPGIGTARAANALSRTANVYRTAAKLGFIEGGLAGAGAGQGSFGNQALSAGIGAVGGAALAPAATLGMRGVAKAGAYLSDAVSATGAASPQAFARRYIRAWAERAGLTPTEAGRFLEELGPDAKLADIPALQQLADTAGQKGYAGTREIIEGEVSERAGRTTQRVIRNMRQWVRDTVPEFAGFVRRYNAKRAERAGKVYAKAFQEGLQPSQELNKAVAVRRFQQTLKKVTEDAELNGNPLVGPLDALDRGLKELSDDIGAALAGNRKYEASQLMTIKNNILDAITVQNQTYARARRLFASEAAMSEAAAFGRDVMKNPGRWAADEISDAVRNYSRGQRLMYQLGGVRGIVDGLERGSAGAGMKRLMRSANTRKMLRQVFPSRGDFDNFIRVVDAEITKSNTANVLGGSPTQLRQANAELADQLAGEVERTVMSGGANRPTEAIWRVLKRVFGDDLTADDWRAVTRELMRNIEPGEARQYLSAPITQALGGPIANAAGMAGIAGAAGAIPLGASQLAPQAQQRAEEWLAEE